MKFKAAATLCFLLAGSLLLSAELAKEDRKSISVDELNNLKIIGKLGIPLGQAVEMEAVIISGTSTNRKQDEGIYLLKVKSVASKPLKVPVVMPFRGQFESADPFPRNASELHKKQLAKEEHLISEELLRELEKNYVDTPVKFLGYESGRFGGVPKGLPEQYPVWAGTGFEFQSELIILKKL